MYPNARLVEQAQIQMLITPDNLISGAHAGEWVSLKDFDRLTVIFAKGAGKAGEDPTLVLQQATDITGAGAKPLTFTRIDVKKGGTSPGVGTFTTVTQAAAASYKDATSAEVSALFVLEVRGQDLDVEGGFDCVNFSLADVGHSPGQAQLGCAIGILWGARYGGASLPSAITD